MKEKEYLEFILEELHHKIERMNDKIGDATKDLEDMNDYFWENFSEFDEYGYEEYDNQTAYLMRSRERDGHFEELKRYKKMVDSPYFGKIVFTYDGEDEPESFYIGIGNLWKEDEMIPLVFDWRAPVSGLFYDFDKGPASYLAPTGELSGEINEKMQFKIKNSKMVYAITCDIKIDDEILRDELAGNADARLKSIVTSIQKEQNAIIRNSSDKILVIQGCAGSGKTSIALHRIAYLLYHNRNSIKASQVLILSPNGIFADYISHILPELGEENINEMSFDDFAYHELKDIAETMELYDYVETLLALYERNEKLAEEYREKVKEKQSYQFVTDMHEFVLRQEYELLVFQDFKCKGIQKSADDIAKLFYEIFPDIPILRRLDSIADYLIDEIETLNNKDFEPEEREKVLMKIRKMYDTTDLLELYCRFLEEYGYESRGLNNGKIAYEDVYPMIYLKYLLWGTKKHKPVKHLIIDEMQDYSYIQFAIIEKLFQCPMTILGDKAQSMTEKNHDVRILLKKLFSRDMREITIQKSYRSTWEIMKFAEEINGDESVIPFDRHGRDVEYHSFDNENSKYEALAEAIRENENAETIAVLVLNAEAAAVVAGRLKGLLHDIPVTLLDRNSVRFHTGVVVTTYYLAKGLEFDSVYVADGDHPVYRTEFGRQALYVCATRALHTLDIYE
ncbi:MAG: AAA family ATPase [Lachnospiraceae bacterium]|nr:AAA family ATPase [Lachnospiraceae bacterium]